MNDLTVGRFIDKALETIDSSNLEHHGVKGMKWGVRKDRGPSYKQRLYSESIGPSKTRVVAKNGDQLSVEKDQIRGMAAAVNRVLRTDPKNYVSSMTVRNSEGKKVGSFQVWRESDSVCRGEWLEIDKKSQGRGYSEAAIRGLIKAAKTDDNLKEVRLMVPKEAEAAKHIYSKLGFKFDKDLGDDFPTYGDLEDWKLNLNRMKGH